MMMPELEIMILLVATVVAFLLSGAYYTVFSRSLAPTGEVTTGNETDRAVSPMIVVAELLRALVLVTVVAGLADLVGVRGWRQGAVFGLVLWIGFPLILWVGAMLHEDTSWRMAALHGGDWLLKLVVVAMILSI